MNFSKFTHHAENNKLDFVMFVYIFATKYNFFMFLLNSN